MAMLPGDAPKDKGDFAIAMLDNRWSRDDFYTKNLIPTKDPKTKELQFLWSNLITRTTVFQEYNDRKAVQRGEKPGRELDFEMALYSYSSYVISSTDAINIIAQRELELEKSTDKQTPEERLKLIPEQLKHLENLLSNMETHNKFIEEFNSQCPTKREHLKCTLTHEKEIKAVTEQIAGLKQLDQTLRAEIEAKQKAAENAEFNNNVKEIESYSRQVREQYDKGFPFDEDFIIKEYSKFREKLGKISSNKKMSDHLKSTFEETLNLGYLATFLGKIDAMKVDFVSKPIQMVLKKLGLIEIDDFQQFEWDVRNAFLADDVIKEINRKDVFERNPFEFINVIQNMRLDKIVEACNLSDPEKANLKKLLVLVNNYDLKWEKNVPTLLLKAKKALSNSLESSKPDPHDKKMWEDRIATYNPTLSAATFFEHVFDRDFQNRLTDVPFPSIADQIKLPQKEFDEFLGSFADFLDYANHDLLLTPMLNNMNVLKHCNGIIRELERNIELGQKINRDFVNRSYEGFNKMIQKLEVVDPKGAEELRHRYYKLINRGFIETVIREIEKLPPSAALPQTIQRMMQRLGFNISPKELDVAKHALIENLKRHLTDPGYAKLLDQPPHLIVEEVVNIQIEIASSMSGLPVEQKQNLKNILKQVNRLANALLQMNREEIEVLKKDIIEVMNEHIKDPAELRLDTELIMRYQSNLPLQSILFEIFSPANQQKVLNEVILSENIKENSEIVRQPKENLEAFNKKLAILLETYKNKFDVKSYTGKQSREMQALLSKKSEVGEEIQFKKIDDWINRNRRHQSFEYNQLMNRGELDYQAVLVDGICASVLFGWILAIQRNPTKKIKSVSDVNPDIQEKSEIFTTASLSKLQSHPTVKSKVKEHAKTEEETKRRASPTKQLHSGATARERIRQSAYILAWNRGEVGRDGREHMPESVLRKEGATVNTLITTPQKDISALIEAVLKLDDEAERKILAKSSGMVEIGFRDPLNGVGHSIGMQIDHVGGIYRFMDPNFGIYTYTDLTEMRKEFAEFLDLFYPKWSEFNAMQYVLKRTDA